MLTIDDRRTKDMDDAIWVEENPEGWLVRVAIADAARVAKPGSDIDREAFARGHTDYFSTGNSPMLPRDLGEWKLSLWPKKERRAIFVEMKLDKGFTLAGTRVSLGTCTSEEKLSYDDIPEIMSSYDQGVEAAKGLQELSPANNIELLVPRVPAQVAAARKLASGLLMRRREAGALVFYDLNNGWVTTEEGFLKRLKDVSETIGYVIVQELMILTNVAVATYAVENNIPFLYRNHEARSAAPERDVILKQIAEAMEVPIIDLEALQKRTHMLFARAEYGAKLLGHYGLNAPAYTHFTSPIRRYADLAVHQQLRAHLKGEPLPYTTEQFAEIGRHLTELGVRERDSASEHFKGRAEERAQRQINARRLDGLPLKEFERAVKTEIKSGDSPSDVLIEAWLRRIRENGISTVTMTAVLMHTSAPDGWHVLKISIVEHLADQPADSITILTQAATLGWNEASYNAGQSGPPHAPSFVCEASLQGHSAKADGKTAKEAKQRAAIRLLAAVAGVDAPLLQEASEALQSPEAPPVVDEGKNPVSALMEVSQARKCPPPEFAFTMAGPPHAPVFTCVGRFIGLETKAAHSSKKEAKALAARRLVELIR